MSPMPTDPTAAEAHASGPRPGSACVCHPGSECALPCLAEAHASEPRDDLTRRMDEIELALEVLVDVEAEPKYDWLRPIGRTDWCRDARKKEVAANLQHITELCRDGEAYRAERQNGAQRKPRRPRKTTRVRPPDGLMTEAEAAAKLGISVKTLREHIAAGALRYVPMGHGKKRVRRKLAPSDLDEFIANQARKDVPCPSTAGRARHTGTSTFTGEVIDFTGPRKPPRDARRKR